MRHSIFLLLLLGLGLQACSGVPAITEEKASFQLPSASLVVGGDSAAVEAATTWLTAHHLPVVTLSKTFQPTGPMVVNWKEASNLDKAQALHAGTLVQVKTLVKSMSIRRPLSDAGTARLPSPQAIYTVQVAIQALDVETGFPVWEGTAKSVIPVSRPELAIAALTQQALAHALAHAPAAWR